MKFTFPDYNKNILNISATLAEFLGVPSKHKVIKVLKDELLNDYKNVVFLCFDGMGIHPLNANLNNGDFLIKNIKCQLTSVFPSTTTNATTTLISATTPSEHGWFAWSLYFNKINKVIDIFQNADHYTGEEIDSEFVWTEIPFNAYYNKAQSEYKINSVFPSYIKSEISKNNYYFSTLEEQFKILNEIVKENGKQFIYSYNDEPDGNMHINGVRHKNSQEIICKINNLVEGFANKNPDTLVIVSADHGHTDVTEHILIYEDERFLSYLKTQPFGEARAMFVNVLPDKKKEFCAYVKSKYKKDVKIFSSKSLLKKGVFGRDNKNSELLGDFIIVMKNNKIFRFCERDPLYKGHHTGLGEEMFVPLIIYGNKN